MKIGFFSVVLGTIVAWSVAMAIGLVAGTAMAFLFLLFAQHFANISALTQTLIMVIVGGYTFIYVTVWVVGFFYASWEAMNNDR